jgi:hypothetical protein
MAVTNFNTSNQTFWKLMGNGLVYRVPIEKPLEMHFQRSELGERLSGEEKK